MAKNVTVLEILEKENDTLDRLLDCQSNVHIAVKTRNWIGLEDDLEKIRALSLEFSALEEKREAACSTGDHHIVTDLFFAFRDHRIVNVPDVRFQFGNLFLGDGQPQFPFGARQFHPKFPPCAIAGIGRKQIEHIRRRIPRRKGRFINVFHGAESFQRRMMLSRSGPTETYPI